MTTEIETYLQTSKKSDELLAKLRQIQEELNQELSKLTQNKMVNKKVMDKIYEKMKITHHQFNEAQNLRKKQEDIIIEKFQIPGNQIANLITAYKFHKFK